MRLSPFSALIPPAALASEVGAVPYDVVDTAEARALAEGKPRSFLRVSRPELELPAGQDPHAAEVYARAAATLSRFVTEGTLVRDGRPNLYVYRIMKADHTQVGVVGCCHVDDYARGVIKRHEKTRADKETDRTQHILATRAHSGPVFLTYADVPAIDRLVAEAVRTAPLATAAGEDGSQHSVWRMAGASLVERTFAAVPACYIADGHHRAAAAARAAERLRADDPDPKPNADYNWFLAVLFPARQLRILPYNRCVKDLNGLTPAEFLGRLRKAVRLTEKAGGPGMIGPREAGMYMGGRWYGLQWETIVGGDPVARLDVSVLQDRVLGPILGIDDPRTNTRIGFVGGSRGMEGLVRQVDGGGAAAAFAMHPVTVADMMAIADAGQIMPPKSTWFEPKLRDGLLVHTF